MNKHETLIRQIAEEMAATGALKISHVNGPVEPAEIVLIAIYVPLARIVVKHMAEAVRNRVWDDHGGMMSYSEQALLEIYLQENGLIPEKEV